MDFLPELKAAVQFSCLLEQFAIFFLFYNMEVTFPSPNFVGMEWEGKWRLPYWISWFLLDSKDDH